ncbi:unnamed protein product [Pylaiella littoralis]
MSSDYERMSPWFWLDLETSGLDPQNDFILEKYVSVTDNAERVGHSARFPAPPLQRATRQGFDVVQGALLLQEPPRKRAFRRVQLFQREPRERGEVAVEFFRVLLCARDRQRAAGASRYEFHEHHSRFAWQHPSPARRCRHQILHHRATQVGSLGRIHGAL